jgi:hypothetical protein
MLTYNIMHVNMHSKFQHVKKKYMSTYKNMHVNTHKNDVEHLADSFQGLPDAHETVKYLTPKSKE